MSSEEATNDGDLKPAAVNVDPNTNTTTTQQAHFTATATATATTTMSEDTLDARKLLVVRQLTTLYKFDTEVVEKAMEEVGPDRSLVIKYILDHDLAKDQGGAVVPKEDCPHIRQHVKLSVDNLPDVREHNVCTYHQDEEHDSNDDGGGGGGGGNKTNGSSCPPGENWLCLECGAVRCSRYGNGHSLSHWKNTKRQEGYEEGHCIAVSLADLSVWCQECDSYLHDPILDPLLQKLEQQKFRDIELEPKKKKRRPCHSFDEQDKASNFDTMPAEADNAAAAAAGGAAVGQHSVDGHQKQQPKAGEEEEEEVDNSSDENDVSDDNSEVGPTIAAVANAVARGVPIELIMQGLEEDEEDLEYPFGKLPTSLEEVANFILSENCKNICILAGAGMSVAAGIPDFRSADGLYATMKPDLLTADPIEREAIREDPTVALEQGMFLQNPLPCLELNREFILGTHNQRWKATLAHRFVELLHAKTGKLVRLYTQNIDGLEDQCTQLPRDKVIAVHGSMDRAECANCGEETDFDEFCEKIQTQIKDLSEKDKTAPKESSPITCHNCGHRHVKPAIVLFRSPLPREFFENAPRDVADIDLFIVIGTSLRVAPANSLVWRAPKTALRLFVNREPVGWHLGVSYGDQAERDFFAQGDCDNVLLNLMSHLGWLEDLEPLLNEHKLPEKSAALLRAKLGKDDRESSENDDENDGDDCAADEAKAGEQECL